MRTGTMAVLLGVLSFGALAHAQAELPVPVGPEALDMPAALQHHVGRILIPAAARMGCKIH
jgi:hypothetical protein